MPGKLPSYHRAEPWRILGKGTVVLGAPQGPGQGMGLKGPASSVQFLGREMLEMQLRDAKADADDERDLGSGSDVTDSSRNEASHIKATTIRGHNGLHKQAKDRTPDGSSCGSFHNMLKELLRSPAGGMMCEILDAGVLLPPLLPCVALEEDRTESTAVGAPSRGMVRAHTVSSSNTTAAESARHTRSSTIAARVAASATSGSKVWSARPVSRESRSAVASAGGR